MNKKFIELMKMYFVMELLVYYDAEKQSFFAKYFESHFYDSSSVARMREEGEGESRERCRGRG